MLEHPYGTMISFIGLVVGCILISGYKINRL